VTETGDRDDGTRTVGTVTIAPSPGGWTAACSTCPWTDTAGEFGYVAITNRSTAHHCLGD
jgi:hypothetical protein